MHEIIGGVLGVALLAFVVMVFWSFLRDTPEPLTPEQEREMLRQQSGMTEEELDELLWGPRGRQA